MLGVELGHHLFHFSLKSLNSENSTVRSLLPGVNIGERRGVESRSCFTFNGLHDGLHSSELVDSSPDVRDLVFLYKDKSLGVKYWRFHNIK